MTTIDSSVEHYHALRPAHYPLLERFELNQIVSENAERASMTLTIVLRAKITLDSSRLMLTFSGVKDLKLRPFVQPLQLSLLEIASLRDQQWEDVNYKVGNMEQDVEFSFTCTDFEAERQG